MDEATNPTTVAMDTDKLNEVANNYMDRFREASEAGGLMNYMDQQSQEFIQGAGAPKLPDTPKLPDVPGPRDNRKRMSDFYSKDRGVQDLMTYSSY